MVGFLWCVFNAALVCIWRENSEISKTKCCCSLGFVTWYSAGKQNQITDLLWIFYFIFGGAGGEEGVRSLCRPRQAQGQSRSQAWLLTAEKQTFSRIYRHCWLWKLQPLTPKPERPQFHRVSHRKHNQNQITKQKRITRAAVTHIKSDQKAETAEQRRPRVAADWIKIPASRQLNKLKEPTWVLIILLSLSVFNKQPANPADGCHAGGLFGERVSPACVY